MQVDRRRIQENIRRFTGQGADALDHAVTVRNDQCAHGAQPVCEGFAGRRNHPGALQKRHLDGGETQHRPGTVDEDRLVLFETGPGKVAGCRLDDHRQRRGIHM
ncbi:hypothetical protein D3C81_1090290 [compost metagenome]